MLAASLVSTKIQGSDRLLLQIYALPSFNTFAPAKGDRRRKASGPRRPEHDAANRNWARNPTPLADFSPRMRQHDQLQR